MPDFTAELTAVPDAISAMTERAAAYLEDGGVDARAVHHATLVLDELLTNIAMHGAVDTAVSVRLAILPERINGEVLDAGAAFDPRAEKDGDVSATLDGPVGGLGLLLVRRVTESLDYARAGDRNRTTFSICRV